MESSSEPFPGVLAADTQVVAPSRGVYSRQEGEIKKRSYRKALYSVGTVEDRRGQKRRIEVAERPVEVGRARRRGSRTPFWRCTLSALPRRGLRRRLGNARRVIGPAAHVANARDLMYHCDGTRGVREMRVCG